MEEAGLAAFWVAEPPPRLALVGPASGPILRGVRLACAAPVDGC